MRLACAVALLSMLFGAGPAMAVPLFTDVVESNTEYSYKFSGTGASDLASSLLRSDSTNNWQLVGGGAVGLDFASSFFHRPDGPTLELSDQILLGSTYDDFVTLAHGAAFDSFSLRITAQDNGSGGVGDFSGELRLTHRGATVPIPGTLALLGIALAGLGISRVRR